MNILHELLPSKGSERREKAENDFFFFCQTYLPHYFSRGSAPYHKILIDIANTRSLSASHIAAIKPLIKKEYHDYLHASKNLKAVVDIEPRGFSKSTRWTLAYPLWRLLYKKSNFVCIFCASQGMANGALQKIKTEIETNEAITSDFGEMTGGVWRENFLSFRNGTALRAFGSGAAVRGVTYRQFRPDLIICDDILKDESARTFTQRQKVYEWFLRAVLPLGQDIFTIIVNTIFHSDDLPSRLLKRIAQGELSGWAGLRFQAITPTGESLWSAYWSAAKLEAKRRELGSSAFSTEYMNEPVSDEERVFRVEWFRFYEKAPRSLRVFQGVDPSAGKHDRFAIVTIGVAADGKIYVLDEFAKTVSVEAAIRALIERYLIYNPLRIGFESVGFQSVYKEFILERAAREGVYLPIKEMKTKGAGKERVLQLQPLIENGQLLFKGGESETVGELLSYPKGEYDDLSDALCYAFSVSKSAKKEATAARANRSHEFRAVFY